MLEQMDRPYHLIHVWNYFAKQPEKHQTAEVESVSYEKILLVSPPDMVEAGASENIVLLVSANVRYRSWEYRACLPIKRAHFLVSVP
jgi:hypothetical protein